MPDWSGLSRLGVYKKGVLASAFIGTSNITWLSLCRVAGSSFMMQVYLMRFAGVGVVIFSNVQAWQQSEVSYLARKYEYRCESRVMGYRLVFAGRPFFMVKAFLKQVTI